MFKGPLRIPSGNDFILCFPWYKKTYVNDKVALLPIEMELSTNLQVVISTNGGATWNLFDSERVQVQGNRVYLNIRASEFKGTLSVKISCELSGQDLTCSWFKVVELVEWTNSSNYSEFIQGSPYLMPSNVAVIAQESIDPAELLSQNTSLVETVRDLSQEMAIIQETSKQGSDSSATNTRLKELLDGIVRSLLDHTIQTEIGFDTILPLLREGEGGAEYIHNFNDAIYDEFYSIKGNLITSYSKEVRGELINKSIIMESSTSIAFHSEAGGTLTIYASNIDSLDYNVLVDGNAVSFNEYGVAKIELMEGFHLITKGSDNTYIFYISLKIEATSYTSKLDIIKELISSVQGDSEVANLTTMRTDVTKILSNQEIIIRKIDQLLQR